MAGPGAFWRRCAALVLAAAIGLLSSAPVFAGDVVRKDHALIIIDEGEHTASEIEYLHTELMNGFASLAALGFAIDDAILPVTAIVRPGEGVAHINKRGEIVLHWLREGRSPILHELTHIVAGYDRSIGHWGPEGLASWVQDSFGGNAAFPTFRLAPEMIRLLHDDNTLLPMRVIFSDHDRNGPFGKGDQWSRWRAYSQSTAFVGYLIDSYDIDSFQKVYNRALADADFNAVYGKPIDELVADWQATISQAPAPSQAARKRYNWFKTNLSRGN